MGNNKVKYGISAGDRVVDRNHPQCDHDVFPFGEVILVKTDYVLIKWDSPFRLMKPIRFYFIQNEEAVRRFGGYKMINDVIF